MSNLRKNLLRILLSLFLGSLFVAHSAHWIQLPLLDRLELIAYDLKLKFWIPSGVDPRLVIVDIDEKSLLEKEEGGEGRWPWPRNRLAELNERLLKEYQVAAVGYDVIFSERDESSGLKVLEKVAANKPGLSSQLKELRSDLDFDGKFAKSMSEKPVTLGFTMQYNKAQKGTLPKSLMTLQDLPLESHNAPEWPGFTGNLERLQKSTPNGGHLNPAIDIDGVIRRVPMLALQGGNYYGSLSLEVMRNMLGNPELGLIWAKGSEPGTFGALQALDVGSMPIPIDDELAALVPYRGPYKSFQYISAVEVFNQRVPAKDLEGKIVLVGTTAAGLLDLRNTPVGEAYPGVEIHANLIAGILDGKIKHRPSSGALLEIGLLLALTLLLAFALPLLGPLSSSALALSGIIGFIVWNGWAFSSANLVLPIASFVSLIALLYIMNVAIGFFTEAKGKRLMTGLFGQYVPPELVDEMSKNPEAFSMEGESRDLTILFSDVRGFTTISEGLDPKELSNLMNAFLTPLTEVIYHNHGTIDKYMGDCIMAFWGAPMKDENHAKHAVQAAFEMGRKLESLQSEFKSRGWPEIKIGIGLNTGLVSVGNMGSSIRLAYTVMGDAVNLASRLEGITKEYGAQIVIGEETKNKLPDLICRELDSVKVKGKNLPITIYEPIGFVGEITPDEKQAVVMFDEVLKLYKAQEWDAAKSALERLMTSSKAIANPTLFDLYLGRIEQFKQYPPGPNWDGTYTFTTK
jgi:adenylate cyclase